MGGTRWGTPDWGCSSLDLPEVPRCEGNQHACVLQLCWRLRPHHPHHGGAPAGSQSYCPLGHLPSLALVHICSSSCMPSPQPSIPAPPLGLGLTETGHSCRSSWSRLESSGTLPSTMACRTSWRPWSGFCRRTLSWAISISILCLTSQTHDHIQKGKQPPGSFQWLPGPPVVRAAHLGSGSIYWSNEPSLQSLPSQSLLCAPGTLGIF